MSMHEDRSAGKPPPGRRVSSALAFVASCLALALLAAAASANLIGYSTPLDLSAAGEDAGQPQVAVDPEGRATVVWQRSDGPNRRIQAVRLDAAGNPGPAHTLSPTGQYASNPQVAVDLEGRATVVWDRFDASNRRIQAVRLDAAGNPGTVHTLSAAVGEAFRSQVAVDREGKATVAWQRSADRRTRIEAVRLDAEGRPGAVHTLSGEVGGAYSPQVAVDPEGRATVVWQPFADRQWRIEAVHLDAAGHPGTVHTLSDEGVASDPQVAVDPEGRATVVWEVYDRPSRRIDTVRLNAAGNPGAVQTLSPPGRRAVRPRVAVDPQGRATVVWQRFDDSNRRIHAVRLNAAGRRGTIHALSAAGQDAFRAQVTVDPVGRATVVWRRAVAGSSFRVQAARLNAAGNPGAVHTLSAPARRPSGFLTQQVAVDPEGRATVVWEHFDGSRDRVQAARSLLADAPANLPAKLRIARAQVQVGASAAQRRGARRLVVRGSLDPRAAGERVVVRFRAAGRRMVTRPMVQPNGAFRVNRRLRGAQRRAGGGQLHLRYRGNDVLRAVGERLRAARRAVRLRIARLGLRQNRFVVAGRVRPRARRQARIEVKFNRPNGDPARLSTRAQVNRRGRFRTRLRIPPAVRELGAWVAVTHPGRARLYGQRRGRAVGG